MMNNESFPRISGTVLANYTHLLADGQKMGGAIAGIIDGDDAWLYYWKVGSQYRNGTTPDKLQPGCRISFEIDRNTGEAFGVSYDVDDVDAEIMVAQ